MTLARGLSGLQPFIVLSSLGDRGERGRRRPKFRMGEVGRPQNRNPRDEPATCADPPSLCAGWGCRGAPDPPCSCSGFPNGKPKHGDREGVRGPLSSPLRRRSPSRKPRCGGVQGATDPPVSRSGSPGGKFRRSGGGDPLWNPWAPVWGPPTGSSGAAGAPPSPELLFEYPPAKK